MSLLDTVSTVKLEITEEYITNKPGPIDGISNREQISDLIEFLGFDLSNEADAAFHINIWARARPVGYDNSGNFWNSGSVNSDVTFEISMTRATKGASDAVYSPPLAIYTYEGAPKTSSDERILASPVWELAGEVACVAILDSIAGAGESAVPVLAKALKYNSLRVSIAAVHALEKTESPLILDPLIVAMQDMRHDNNSKFGRGWPVSRAAASALEPFGKEAVKPLVELLESPDRDVRLRTLKLLRKINDESAAEAIAKKLDDWDPEIRELAAELLDAVRYTPEPTSREAMVYYYAKEDWESLGKMEGGPESLVNLLVSSNLPTGDIRNELVKIGDPAGPFLMDALGKKELGEGHTAYVRRCNQLENASFVLGEIADERAVPLLIEGLKEMSPAPPNYPDNWFNHVEKNYRGPAKEELQKAICKIMGGSDCPEMGSDWKVWNGWWAQMQETQ